MAAKRAPSALAVEAARNVPPAHDRFDPEPIGMPGKDVGGRTADRAGGAEDGDDRAISPVLR